MDQVQDPNGQAQAALARVVQGFGLPVLGQADLLEGLLNDDVPALTRQIAILTEAARCGMADLLAERVKQGVSPQAAVAMVVSEVTSRSDMDSAGALWAAQAFAAAIGSDLTSQPSPASVPEVPPQAAAPPTNVVNLGGQVTPAPGMPAGSEETVRPGALPWPTSPDVPSSDQPTTAQPVPQGLSAPQVPPGQAPTVQQWPPQGQQWPPQGQQWPPQGQQWPPQGQQWPPQGQQWPPQGQPQWGVPQWQTGPQWVPQLATGQQWPVGPRGAPLAPIATGAAVCAALAVGLSVLLQLFWATVHRTTAGTAVFWLSTVVLIIAGIVAAIVTAQDRRTGAGLTMVIGFALPSVSWDIYEAAFAPNTAVTQNQRHELLGTSMISLLAALAAALIAIAALASRRQLGKQKADPLPIVMLILGLVFPLTNIVAQVKFEGFAFGNVLGANVRGYYILWGIFFLVLFALPPVLSVFFSPGSRAQLALWVGWVVVVLGWQLSDSPVNGEKAATGLILSWLTWVLVLACTLVLAVRGPVARPAAGQPGSPVLPVPGAPWPGNPV